MNKQQPDADKSGQVQASQATLDPIIAALKDKMTDDQKFFLANIVILRKQERLIPELEVDVQKYPRIRKKRQK